MSVGKLPCHSDTGHVPRPLLDVEGGQLLIPMVGHVEAYHLRNSLAEARYLDFYKTFDRERHMGWNWAWRQAQLNMPENFKEKK